MAGVGRPGSHRVRTGKHFTNQGRPAPLVGPAAILSHSCTRIRRPPSTSHSAGPARQQQACRRTDLDCGCRPARSPRHDCKQQSQPMPHTHAELDTCRCSEPPGVPVSNTDRGGLNEAGVNKRIGNRSCVYGLVQLESSKSQQA